jgi:hypothetical protein
MDFSGWKGMDLVAIVNTAPKERKDSYIIVWDFESETFKFKGKKYKGKNYLEKFVEKLNKKVKLRSRDPRCMTIMERLESVLMMIAIFIVVIMLFFDFENKGKKISVFFGCLLGFHLTVLCWFSAWRTCRSWMRRGRIRRFLEREKLENGFLAFVGPKGGFLVLKKEVGK